jgi:hypothetical protein
LPDFSWYNLPSREKYTKWHQNIPNGHKIYQIATKYTKWPQHIPNGQLIYQHLPLKDTNYKIYPNWDFWLESIPSGNPDSVCASKNVLETSAPSWTILYVSAGCRCDSSGDKTDNYFRRKSWKQS